MESSMVSGVASIQEIFKLKFKDKSLEEVINTYNENRGISLSIPKYQREYLWETEKIKTFVKDIRDKSKFLGIISLEKNIDNNTLDIVDGQQRITTLMLMFVYLYNKFIENGEKVGANTILEVMENSSGFVLKNDTVKEFIHKVGDLLSIDVNEQDDIYHQKSNFIDAYNAIGKTLEVYKKNDNINEWIGELISTELHALDSTMVVVANVVSKNEGSIEEIYIDINEKAQMLDAENIFKGYCFSKIKNKSEQEKLKEIWTQIKKKFYSIKDLQFKDLGSLLHMFLIIKEQNIKITRKLHIDDKHYLSDKLPSQVMNLLDEVNEFEGNLSRFKNNVNSKTYKFENICCANRTINDDLEFLKDIATYIIYDKNNLYKLPFFHYINMNMKKEKKVSQIEMVSFFRAYYVYTYIFSNLVKEKKRESVSLPIIKTISDNKVSPIVDLITELKSTIEKKNLINLNMKKNNLPIVFSIIDSLESEKDANEIIRIKLKSYAPLSFEHLVVNQSLKVKWENSAGEVYLFDEKDLYKDFKGKKENQNNFIRIPQLNNNEMSNWDIIKKIEYLKNNNFNRRKHINLYMEHITNLDAYQDLINARVNNWTRVKVLESYIRFLEEFYSMEQLDILNNKLYKEFKERIQNL